MQHVQILNFAWRLIDEKFNYQMNTLLTIWTEMVVFVFKFLDANSLVIKYLHIKRKNIIYFVNKSFSEAWYMLNRKYWMDDDLRKQIKYNGIIIFAPRKNVREKAWVGWNKWTCNLFAVDCGRSTSTCNCEIHVIATLTPLPFHCNGVL